MLAESLMTFSSSIQVEKAAPMHVDILWEMGQSRSETRTLPQNGISCVVTAVFYISLLHWSMHPLLFASSLEGAFQPSLTSLSTPFAIVSLGCHSEDIFKYVARKHGVNNEYHLLLQKCQEVP